MLTIAIDGPSASGKSTTAKALAEKLNIYHLNTGAIYRAVSVYMAEHNINVYNLEDVKNALKNVNVYIKFENKEQITFVNDIDVTNKLYTSEIGKLASVVSAYTFVREKTLNLQREVAKNYPVVMEGRDITSVVLPDAKYKFFLSASNETRAKRRLTNFLDAGENITFEEVLKDLIERDKRDTTRETNPLILVEDAILIDTDNYSVDEVVDIICSYIKE